MIVAAGEALVDLVPDGLHRLAAHPGGGAFNTARALGRLRQPVSFIGAVSDDALGTTLRAALEQDGVSLDAVVATDRPTTLALAHRDRSGSMSYKFYIDGTAAPDLRRSEAISALPCEFDTLYLGGLGLMLEPIASTLTAVLAAAASCGALVMCDPNIRPSIISDRTQYLARLDTVLTQTDVLKASAEDLAWLQPGRPVISAARGLIAHGPRVVLVTIGNEGAIVVTKRDSVSVSAPHVTVIDTIGAGDAFSAGFLAAWRTGSPTRGPSPREQLTDLGAVTAAARFACLTASRTCEHAGASPPGARAA
jgi:fructokinase